MSALATLDRSCISLIDIYCKAAKTFYNRSKPRTLQLPIIASEYFDDEDDDEDDIFIRYQEFTVFGLAPELYYFFRYYNSDNTKDLLALIRYWNIPLRGVYSVYDVESGQTMRFELSGKKVYLMSSAVQSERLTPLNTASNNEPIINLQE